MFLDRYRDSIDILQETLLKSDTKEVRRALAMVYVNWSDSLDLEDIVDVAQKYRLLEQGLRVYPNEPLIFDRLMRILQSGDGKMAKKQLVELLTHGHAQALVHLLLGTLAGVEGDSKQAIFHLERAHEIEPNTPIVMNNLAWHMSQTESGDLDAALKLSNLVVKRWPSIVAFRDTRGRILAGLKRWREALVDLEFALHGLDRSPGLHKTLAVVYENLGNKALADSHAARFQELTQQPAP
jgi:tetratricopeptide (TPR) repeat protein